jgi:hypothetical protein
MRPAVALKDLVDAGVLDPGVATVLTFAHDDGCDHWRGRDCNCDVRIIVSRLPDAPGRRQRRPEA